jgi:hypothetical protein
MLLVYTMDVTFFLEIYWNIASIPMVYFSVYVNCMLYDFDVCEIAGGAQW